MPDYLVPSSEGVILFLKVLPRSSRNQLAGSHNGELKLKLTAPPVAGAANRSCCDYLSRLLQVPAGRIEILAGANSRHKKLLIRGATRADVENRLTINS
ncbi:MAG: DUF167 domain-containing protein [Pelovirga sp.]